MPSNPIISLEAQAQLATNMRGALLDLFPVCRSITGNGVRQSLEYLNNIIPLSLTEIPSGTQVFDWVVPPEWNIKDAWIADSTGKRIVDFQESNLHVVNYSVPVRQRLHLDALRAHLHTLPNQPDLIPYRTSYYREDWGFCLSQNQLDSMPPEEYEVVIDSTLAPGSLTYGEVYLPGESEDEILFSSHICHPSLANDNLSGMVVAAYLAERLQHLSLHYSCRFVFVPATIGSICWLWNNQSTATRIKHGLVLTGLGGNSGLCYKQSRNGDQPIDKAAALVLKQKNSDQILEFSPFGYDERQYCSPGFNLPIGRLSRAPHGTYPEYHTSADNPDLVQPEHLLDSLQACVDIVNVLENNRYFENLKPYGEPMLSRYDLYSAMGGLKVSGVSELAVPWILNLSDGKHDLIDIAEKSGLHFEQVIATANTLLANNLIRELNQ